MTQLSISSAINHERLEDEVIAINLETGAYYAIHAAGADCWSVAVAGGDGTATWVLDELEQAFLEQDSPVPALAVLPCGTGNDLSRVLGWAGSSTCQAGTCGKLPAGPG